MEIEDIEEKLENLGIEVELNVNAIGDTDEEMREAKKVIEITVTGPVEEFVDLLYAQACLLVLRAAEAHKSHDLLRA